MSFFKTILAGVLLGTASLSWATTGSVPSCYTANKLQMAVPAPVREVFIMLDQTTPLDAALQKKVIENVANVLQPGTAYSIATFSSFGQGRYLELLASGVMEVALSESARNSIGSVVLRNFDACLVSQRNFVRKTAAAALQQAFSGISVDYAKSDVMASIKEMSARIKQSQANSKVLFLISDMLENSGVSKFYANSNVRQINPVAELQKATSSDMLSDLDGARVFVLGAGLVQDPKSKGRANDSGVYRSPQTMNALKDFWARYFQNSNATLQAFGMPALLVPVQ